MHDSLPVCRLQCVGDLNGSVQHLLQREWSLTEAVAESRPVQELQHQVGQALELADVVDRANVRMIQRRNGPRLPVEPFGAASIGPLAVDQDLDRDRPIQPEVSCPVDLAHAARPNEGLDFVGAEERSSWKVTRHVGLGR